VGLPHPNEQFQNDAETLPAEVLNHKSSKVPIHNNQTYSAAWRRPATTASQSEEAKEKPSF
jgi:hypothetical protein